MFRIIPIKSHVSRLTAVVLLAVSAGFIILPDSSTYSTGETFIKSHAPVSDNYPGIVAADDKEDIDEDGAIDFQISINYPSEFDSYILVDGTYRHKAGLSSVKLPTQFYLVNRQLLI